MGTRPLTTFAKINCIRRAYMIYECNDDNTIRYCSQRKDSLTFFSEGVKIV